MLLEGTFRSQLAALSNSLFQNMLDHTPKALQPEVKEELRRLYESVDLESARKVRDQIIKTYESKAPKATALLDEAFDDITAVLALPLKYRKRLRTTNGVERLNQEIRRRERVIRIFPMRHLSSGSWVLY